MSTSLRCCVRLLGLALLGSLGLSAPTIGQGCEQTYAGYYKATIHAVNACHPSINCSTHCLTQVDVDIKTLGGCTASSGSFLFCGESQDTVAFVACQAAHLITPANGAYWAVIGAGLCQGFVNYVAIY
jgi:hypothetical protein